MRTTEQKTVVSFGHLWGFGLLRGLISGSLAGLGVLLVMMLASLIGSSSTSTEDSPLYAVMVSITYGLPIGAITGLLSVLPAPVLLSLITPRRAGTVSVWAASALSAVVGTGVLWALLGRYNESLLSTWWVWVAVAATFALAYWQLRSLLKPHTSTELEQPRPTVAR